MAKNYIGFPLNKFLTLISKDKVLDKQSGVTIPLSSVLSARPPSDGAVPVRPPIPTIEDVEIKKEVEIVVGVDGQKIEFSLANSDGSVPSDAGFLVEVYSSGSDGKLSRVFREDLVDVINDETISEGFSSYLVLEVDK